MQAKKQVQRPQHGIVYGKLEEPKRQVWLEHRGSE